MSIYSGFYSETIKLMAKVQVFCLSKFSHDKCFLFLLFLLYDYYFVLDEGKKAGAWHNVGH